MRRISNIFRAARSLGVFGIILVFSVGIIVESTLSFFALGHSQGEAYAQTLKLDALEDGLKSNLLEQEINETYLVLSEGDEDYLNAHTESGDLIDEAIASLRAEEFRVSPDEADTIDELARVQGHYRQTSTEIVAATTAGDWDRVERLQQEKSNAQTARMHKQVEDLIFGTKMALTRTVQQSRLQFKRSVFAGVIGLIILPVLVVWAFVVASRITQPVLTLTNAVVAIEGDQFRSDLLADVPDRRDGLGRLAQAVARMAQTIKGREKALEQETAELRDQLYAARRRKRLPASPKRDTLES